MRYELLPQPRGRNSHVRTRRATEAELEAARQGEFEVFNGVELTTYASGKVVATLRIRDRQS